MLPCIYVSGGYKVDLSTKYLGLELKNPLIAASCKMTSKIDKLLECEKAGLGAVVLKSLFEEQISSDMNNMIGGMDLSTHADAMDFFNGVKRSDRIFKIGIF